jgi:hypothetical protein
MDSVGKLINAINGYTTNIKTLVEDDFPEISEPKDEESSEEEDNVLKDDKDVEKNRSKIKYLSTFFKKRDNGMLLIPAWYRLLEREMGVVYTSVKCNLDSIEKIDYTKIDSLKRDSSVKLGRNVYERVKKYGKIETIEFFDDFDTGEHKDIVIITFVSEDSATKMLRDNLYDDFQRLERSKTRIFPCHEECVIYDHRMNSFNNKKFCNTIWVYKPENFAVVFGQVRKRTTLPNKCETFLFRNHSIASSVLEMYQKAGAICGIVDSIM